MRLAEFGTITYGLLRQPSLTRAPSQYLLVLSHMRSRSSVLSHILGSHPQIEGYLENHQAYRSRWDFIRLKAKLRYAIGRNLQATYVLDKVLHNHRVIRPELLQRDNVNALFLLRKAADAIPSIARLLNPEKPQLAVERAVGYYQQRLLTLADYAVMKPANAWFVESDDLISNTEVTLSELSQGLRLDQPLAPKYERFKFSGRPGYGDASASLMAGHLDTRPPASRDQPTPWIPEDLLVRSEQQYVECCRCCQEFTRRLGETRTVPLSAVA